MGKTCLESRWVVKLFSNHNLLGEMRFLGRFDCLFHGSNSVAAFKRIPITTQEFQVALQINPWIL